MSADIVNLASIVNGLQETLNGVQRERRDLSRSLGTAFCVLGLPASTVDELNRLGEAAGVFAAIGSYLRKR